MNLPRMLLVLVALAALLCTHCPAASAMSPDQESSVIELAHRIEGIAKHSVGENRILRTIAVALNDRTALEALLTDPGSAAYKAGLISLAQAVKAYAWIGRDDQVLMWALQTVANRLRSLLIGDV
ncbi:hypothetical protein IW140_006573 [Coemansia sp. RSA 1813]|nr:hypothetical protein EV178_006512 [Coemansia sp. RSA 1646]KAJ1764602.1 hypothetical protein LPJ74_006616 [Coemansia sp. RSA 1843]KAJ2084957.1 hypothetical protein IW138_006535 [Coemansia sp. RSA 986]KAJ2210066.1 hypothetical protein EV179_006449 [Coemansia sp. RSA 487]KAJ2561415.1 hypothetical protein IW140_006573 [Coemansia sp. RSA 1813]